jgi:tRNA(fMet)-specific endonuclease VapC
MGYLLDTTTASYVMDGTEAVARRLRITLDSELVYTSVITEGELLAGAMRMGRSRRDEILEQANLLLGDLTAIITVTRDVASRYARLRRDLEGRGRTVGVNDLWIASIAVANDLTLVAHDKDFQRVEGLKLEDWLES